MVLIFLILVAVGFVFPPAWLGLVGFAIYLYASRHSRRDSAIESRVKRMIAARQSHATFGDLYYEAARAYAIAKGARASSDQSASASVLVDGRVYFVIFMRAHGGGTDIMVQDQREVDRELESGILPR